MKRTAILALLLFTTACLDDGGTEPKARQTYRFNFIFINNSKNATHNAGRFEGHNIGSSSIFGPYGVANGQAVGSFVQEADVGDGKTAVEATFTVPGGVSVKQSLFNVPVQANKQTTVTAVWTGTEVVLAAKVDPGQAWKLDRVTGEASGNWSDQFGTASGTLVFSVPAMVFEGDTENVAATFSATVSHATGFFRNVDLSVGIVDRGFGNLNVNRVANLGQAAPTRSGSVTVNGAWTIVAGSTSVVLEAGGNVLQGGPRGSAVNLRATYVKF